MDGIAGRVHLVTGGYGGIAQATADYLVKAGGTVVLGGRNDEAGRAAAAALGNATGAQAHYVHMDVANPASVDTAVEHVESQIGPIHGLVINAAIALFGSSYEMSNEDWRAVLATNLDGAYYCARSCGRRMRSRGGSVVIISSISARTSGYPAAFAAYGASKAAVSHLAEMLGVEWAPDGIRVNAVEPGYTRTLAIDHLRRDAPHVADQILELIPQHRFIEPIEIARVIGFLLSDLSSALTGSVVVADAGLSAK